MKSFFLALAISSVALSYAQSPSDSLFNTDQVITVDLDFGDQDFWGALTANYDADQGATLTADITLTDLTGTYTYYNVEVDLKGNSSYSHPGTKKSFKVDLNDNIQGQKYHGLAKVHFNNCWGDPTFMREKIFFDNCQRQGVLAPRVLYANVSMNGTFWGFYNLVEPVDKDFLDRWVDDNNGNLFKASDNFGGGGGGGGSGGDAEADLAFYGTDQSSYTDRYELKLNEAENDWSDLIDLLDVINNSADVELATQLPAQFVWEPLLRSLALDNVFGNLDSYIHSARNFYVYHDSTTFLWNWIKWDANMAFGSYPAQGQNALTLSPTYAAADRPLMTRIMAVPALRAQYLTAYCSVKETFTNADLDPRIDAITALIQPHVANDPNKQYTLAQFTNNIAGDIAVSGGGPGGSQTIRGLKSFIATRSANLDAALDCATTAIAEQANTGVPLLYPNPTVDRVTIELPPGRSLKGISLTDAVGRQLPVVATGNTLDMRAFPAGLYTVVVSTETGRHSTRVEKH